MPSPKRVVLVAYPGAAALDVTGPTSVLAAANMLAGCKAYATGVASWTGGLVPMSGDVTIATIALRRIPPRSVHTMLVAGGEEAAVSAMTKDVVARRWILRTAEVCARLGSVCSGAIVLAGHCLLAGQRVTTHCAVS